MTRNREQKSKRSAVEWAKLRPRVTRKLLADITRRIVEKFNPHKVVLFGSYVKGRPNIYSDVDLLVVMDSKETVPKRTIRVREVAKVPFLPMDVVVRTPHEVERRLAIGDQFISEILTNGKVLYQREGTP